LIDKIEELYCAGVDSLKIEGRLKQPHYVGNVVAQYRKAADNVLLSKNEKIDYSSLKRAYNRGNFTLGYNYENSKDIIFEKVNGNIGEEIGEVVGFDKGALKIKYKSELNIGDGVKIIKNGKELGGFSVDNLKKINELYYIYGNKKFDLGSKVYLTSEKIQIDKYNNISPKLSIKFVLKANVGERLELRAESRGVESIVIGDTVQEAKSCGASKESVSEQLLRLGESDFESSEQDIEFETDRSKPCFIPKSTLNNLRREAVEKLREKLIENFEQARQAVTFDNSLSQYLRAKPYAASNNIYVEVDGKEQDFLALSKLNSKIRLCLPISINLAKNLNIILKDGLIKNNIEKIFLKLPRVARGDDYDIIAKMLKNCIELFDGIVADNLYAVYLAKEFNKEILGGIGLNIYNDNYRNILGLDCAVNSIELNKNELIDNALIYGFGKLPIMTLLHCPIQVSTRCDCSNCKYDENFSYFDKRGEYKVRRLKFKYCQFELYNQQTVDVRNKLSLLNSNFYLDLRYCSQDEIVNIINDFVKKSGVSVDNSTYGHLFRGVK
nr:DUF3656 domain-containing protein [Clostridia bacterium]